MQDDGALKWMMWIIVLVFVSCFVGYGVIVRGCNPSAWHFIAEAIGKCPKILPYPYN